MAVLLSSLLIVIFLALIWVYYKFKKSYQFWKKLGVPYLEPSFPLGNVQDSVFKQKHFAYISQDFYRKLKHFGDFAGVFFFNKPTLIVTSPEFAKTVLVRDFQYFVDRGVYYNKKDDPLSANLFFIEGDEWRHLRTKISPTFTSGKMKMMFHTIHIVGEELVKYLNTIVTESDANSIDIREYLARFTTDVIGSCAFGLECNSIIDPKSEFREMGKKMFNFTKIQSLKLFLSMLNVKKARELGIQFNSNEVIDFVMQLVQKTIRHRRDNNIRRNDFMQLMIDLHKDNDDADNVDGLSLEEIAAQSFVFFFGGFETSSTTMTYTLYELAKNKSIQEKLRNEILLNSKLESNFSYDDVMSMTYLDQVVHGNADFVLLFFCFLLIH